jgi:hypothetical protein
MPGWPQIQATYGYGQTIAHGITLGTLLDLKVSKVKRVIWVIQVSRVRLAIPDLRVRKAL